MIGIVLIVLIILAVFGFVSVATVGAFVVNMFLLGVAFMLVVGLWSWVAGRGR